MSPPWPPGFQRIPKEDWTEAPLESLALKYDTVERHGWYDNLDPTVEDLRACLREGDIVIDYSGGTGILIGRLLAAIGPLQVGVLNVDSSPKFLRLALEKARHDPRVAFRLLRYLKAEHRLQSLDEVLEPALQRRGVDAVVSTNAIHLYYGLDETLRSWARVLRPGGRVFVQSGNIRSGPPGEAWIIDDTVEAVQPAAARIVRSDPRYAAYRAVLDDATAMAAHAAVRARFFLPARPLEHYTHALGAAGLQLVDVRTRPIRARTDEWFEFLSVYHEGVLGWVGGSERVEGDPPTPPALADRLALLRAALDAVFGGRDAFEATWTYIACRKPPG